VIAKRIIDAAKKGERDPVRLRNAGLAALGFDKEERGGLGRLTGELVLDQRKPRPRTRQVVEGRDKAKRSCASAAVRHYPRLPLIVCPVPDSEMIMT
jgi:hypothetical protein